MVATQQLRRRLGDVLYDSFFQYAVNITHTTGLETLSSVISILSDSHFVCVQSSYSNGTSASGLAAAPNPATLIAGGTLVQLTDGGSSRFLSNIPVPANCLFGTAQRPYLWPLTHLFRANSFIGVQSAGQTASLAGLTVRYVFGGYKVPLGSAPELNL